MLPYVVTFFDIAADEEVIHEAVETIESSGSFLPYIIGGAVIIAAVITLIVLLRARKNNAN